MTDRELWLQAQLTKRERELNAIYALDTARDESPSSEAFLNGCAAVIQSMLQPELLHIITLDIADCPAFNLMHERWRPDDGLALMTMTSRALNEGEHSTMQLEAGEILTYALHVNGERLGMLMLGRQANRWSSDERDLIDAMISQIDSAIAHLRTLHQLQRRQKELETIYQLDRLIDSTPDFDAALTKALELLSETINAMWSFIMLYTPDEQELELRATSHQDLSQSGSSIGRSLRQLARRTIDQGHLLRTENIDANIGAYIGVPLILQNQIIGVFGGANPPGGPVFRVDEVHMLHAIASQMDTAVFEDRQQQHIRETFSRYVSPSVVDLMLHMPDQDYLEVHRQHLTMLFSDMRGFTSVSEQLPADVVAHMLNEHLAVMTTTIREAGGTVDKFVGDEVVAFFGAPLPRADHPLLAVRTAQTMQQQHTALMQTWAERGLPSLPIGIGVATGEVIVGNIGSTHMMNYTAIGPEVNLAARLCGAAAPHQILISAATYRAVANEIQAVPVEPLHLRHIAQPVEAYSVEGWIGPPAEAQADESIEFD